MLNAVFSKLHLNTKLYSVIDIKSVTILWGKNILALGNAGIKGHILYAVSVI